MTVGGTVVVVGGAIVVVGVVVVVTAGVGMPVSVDRVTPAIEAAFAQ